MDAKHKVQIGEAAGFAVTSASGVFIQLNTQWLGEHPHWVNGLYITAIVLATLFVSQTELMKRLLQGTTLPNPQNAPLPPSVSATANPVFSPQINPVISPVISPSFDIHLPANPPSPNVTPATKNYDIRLHGLLALLVDQTPISWSSSQPKNTGEYAVSLLRVRNFGSFVNSVAANIDFTSPEGHHCYVGRAYWLDYSENAIRIDPGEEKFVVLGRVEHGSGAWLYAQNSRKIRAKWKRNEIELHPLEEERLPNISYIDAKVTILSAATSEEFASTTYRIFKEGLTSELR